jgi:hypothetical protein
MSLHSGPMDRVTRDQATARRPEPRRLHLRRPGNCVACGVALEVGAEALWDPDARTVRCVECGTGGDHAADAAIDAGVAGASAQREYEHRKAGREVRTKDRFGKQLGGVILALTDQPQTTRAWARGARGEKELAAALEGVGGIRVLHDRRVPGTRGNLDHLVIAPAGIFVVDAKRYEGLIRIRDVGGFFKTDERLYVGSRDCSKLADNMGRQVEAVERVLRSVPVEPLPPIISVLCFVKGDWPLLRPPTSFRGVRLESERSIRKFLTGSQQLDDRGIDRLAVLLSSAFPPR